MRWWLVLTVLALAGCGGHARPAISHDGRAVLRDAYDGKLDRHWSCGSLRAADRRLPSSPPAYSAISALIRSAEARACDAALQGLREGATAAQVRSALGRPDRAPRCWIYRWAALRDTGDGARVCFDGGRAALIQGAAHG